MPAVVAGAKAGADLRVRTQLDQGREHIRAGDLEAARSVFTSVIEANPDNAPALLGLGQVNFLEEDFDAAMQCCQEALARNPQAPGAKIMMARIHEKLGDIDAAMGEYEEAIGMDPSRGLPHRRISRMFAQNDDSAEAVARLRSALQYNPQQVTTRFMLASTLERSGDVAGAKSEYQRLVETMPIAAFRLGRLHLQDGELSAARPLLEKAVRSVPDRLPPRLALAAALKGLGEPEGALAVLEEAQKLNSKNSAVPAMMIAECQIDLGRPEEALKSLRQALRRARKRPGLLHKRLGDVLMTLARYKEAVEEYGAALLREPEFAEKNPQLRSLLDQAQTPGEDVERLAKQIHSMIASISEAKRAALKDRPRRGGASRRVMDSKALERMLATVRGKANNN